MIAAVADTLGRHGLTAVGAFHPVVGDAVPEGIRTLVLVGPRGGSLWPVFSASPEYRDDRPDPLDRWSRRVLDAVGAEFRARTLYPFDGPPWLPFPHWAARGEVARPSPVGMQVSPSRGLWLSYRGALGFSERLAIRTGPREHPCEPCSAPCMSACPVDAFASGGYEVERCAAHIASEAGRACRESGCLVRHACPAGRDAVPSAGQSAFHMAAFLRARRHRAR